MENILAIRGNASGNSSEESVSSPHNLEMAPPLQSGCSPVFEKHGLPPDHEQDS
ncbi:MAG TPA: hypothetical protein ACFYDZ_06950 [Candidatus Brocadiaceae bacterium]